MVSSDPFLLYFQSSQSLLHFTLPASGEDFGALLGFKVKFAFGKFSGVSPSFDLLFSLKFLLYSELLALRQRALN